MAFKRVSQMPAAGTLAGDELMMVSRLSATVKLTASTISAQAGDRSFNDSAGGFLAAGFRVEQQVHVSGFSAAPNNLYTGTVTSVTASKLVIAGADGAGIVNAAAGDAVTITAWETVRTTAQDIASLGGGGSSADRSAVTALTIAGGIVDVDAGAGDYFTLTLTANVTGVAFSGLPPEGHGASIMLQLTQDGAGGKTFALPSSWSLTNGSVSAVASAAGAKTWIVLTTFDAGASWSATLSTAAA